MIRLILQTVGLLMAAGLVIALAVVLVVSVTQPSLGQDHPIELHRVPAPVDRVSRPCHRIEDTLARNIEANENDHRVGEYFVITYKDGTQVITDIDRTAGSIYVFGYDLAGCLAPPVVKMRLVPRAVAAFFTHLNSSPKIEGYQRVSYDARPTEDDT